jgi:hypothetical protein
MLLLNLKIRTWIPGVPRTTQNIVACHKYFSGEKFSDHASRRRAPALRSGTHLNSLVVLCRLKNHKHQTGHCEKEYCNTDEDVGANVFTFDDTSFH